MLLDLLDICPILLGSKIIEFPHQIYHVAKFALLILIHTSMQHLSTILYCVLQVELVATLTAFPISSLKCFSHITASFGHDWSAVHSHLVMNIAAMHYTASWAQLLCNVCSYDLKCLYVWSRQLQCSGLCSTVHPWGLVRGIYPQETHKVYCLQVWHQA